MLFLCAFMVGIVLLAIAALLWGADSRDGIDSLEWQRRQSWPGFH